MTEDTNTPDSSPTSRDLIREIIRRARRSRWCRIGLPLVVVVAAAAIALPLTLSPGAMTLHGSITVDPSSYEDAGCPPSGGYSDISPGTAVKVTGSDGKTLATGAIGRNSAEGSDQTGNCTLKFTVPDIPRGQDKYGVEVSHRGTLMFSEKRIRTGDVSLSLGD